jgi:asparagine synthase (glutamine-hydrolysing)
MCGIAGIVSRTGAPVDQAALRSMLDAVVHRGPDGHGVHVTSAVGLGHRRLAILDLSDAAHQPMEAAGGDFVVTFNGEIYNYVELRSELRALGHQFRSQSDTEVLLAAYAEWGERCVDRLNGMWAFAILDTRHSRLFCSRDRFGEKPFYYVADGPVFAFASEIRQLLPVLGKRVARRSRVLRFLIANLAEGVDDTFFEGISKLPGGCNLTYDLATHRHAVTRYYDVQRAAHAPPGSDTDAIERVAFLLRDAVAVRLRADVTVGTCLSGGLDSSSVASIAASLHGGRAGPRFAAITAVSEQRERDESRFAALVATRAALDWHTVTPSTEDFRTHLDDVFVAQEEPFPSASIVMQFFVLREAKRLGIKVLLDGQGGDELFLGYERYFAAHYLSQTKRQGPWAALRDAMSAGARNAAVSPLRLLGMYAYFNNPSLRWMHYRLRSRHIRRWPNLFPELVEYASASRNVNRLQALEIASSNLPALLRYEDKNSMRHSVEARLPFLDHRLVEYAIALPGDLKIRHGWTKYVLRQAVDLHLPREITWRTQKFGFEAPEAIWFKAYRSEMMAEIARSHVLAEVAGLRMADVSVLGADAGALWRLFAVARWERLFAVTP